MLCMWRFAWGVALYVLDCARTARLRKFGVTHRGRAGSLVPECCYLVQQPAESFFQRACSVGGETCSFDYPHQLARV